MKQQEYINLLKEEYGEYKCIMASLELENVEQTYPNMNMTAYPKELMILTNTSTLDNTRVPKSS